MKRRAYGGAMAVGWLLVIALACWVVPLRIAQIRAGDVPGATYVVDSPIAASASRN